MVLISSFFPSWDLALNPPLWGVQPQKQADEPCNVPAVSPSNVHRVDRQDTPLGHPVSVDTDDSEATEHEVTEHEVTESQAQPQSFLLSLEQSRPLPPLPI